MTMQPMSVGGDPDSVGAAERNLRLAMKLIGAGNLTLVAFIYGDRYLFDSKAGFAWSPHHYDEHGNTTLEFEWMIIFTYFGLGVCLILASLDRSGPRQREVADQLLYLRRLRGARSRNARRGDLGLRERVGAPDALRRRSSFIRRFSHPIRPEAQVRIEAELIIIRGMGWSAMNYECTCRRGQEEVN